MRIPILLASMLLAPMLGAAPASQPTAFPTTRPGHDREPWVFRCVLDGNARSVVVSLGQHRWIAYDAATCSLTKFWVGDIELTGPVYDYKHGPQPRAQGALLLDRKAAIWRSRGQTITGLSTDSAPPEPVVGGKLAYRGYSQHSDAVTFHYEHQDPRYDGDKRVRIDETPTMSVAENGNTILRRTIQITFPERDPTMPTVSVRVALPTSDQVVAIRLIDGEANHFQYPNSLESDPLKAPAAIAFDPSKNSELGIGKTGTIVIETELKMPEK
jgi:hypothetical protein